MHNSGGESVDLELRLIADPGLSVESPEKLIVRGLRPGESRRVAWTLRASDSRIYGLRLEVSGKFLNASYTAKIPVFSRVLPDSALLEASGVIASSLSGDIAVKLENYAVCFVKNPFGYGPIVVMVRKESEWIPVAVLTSHALLTRIIGRELVEKVYLIPGEVEVGDTQLKFTCVDVDSRGVGWVFESCWKLLNESIESEVNIRSSETSLVSHFSVTMYAGELSFGSSKDEALFPGLEWLVTGENSSSTLDIASPSNLRNAPHPLKVTVPLMAVRKNDVLVAILWNPHYLWDGSHNMVSPEFASPNWIEGQDNHMLRLFVPTVPDWVLENEDEAFKPYKLTPDKHLSISFIVYAANSDTVLDAVREWIRVYGLPKPVMPRSLVEELRVSMKAYLRSLWSPGKGWSHASGWKPQPYPGYALLLWLTSLVEENPSLRSELRERFHEAVKIALELRGAGYIASGEGCHIPGWQLPFHVGYLREGLGYLRTYIYHIILSQGEDGEWGFQPNERTRVLGKPGARVVGLTATMAAEVLRWARMTGDKSALEAGLRALEAMKRYRVPRGAQSWEIPLHTPDILAAAKAIEAYLEGYIATGNREYLDAARYWAYAGLPFIYLWSVSERPVMLYASIPVYGATFYKSPVWIGRPVQWCGLVYAYQLLRLSKYDGDFPWRRIGEGILASGMHQQVVEGRWAGTYPDSWDLILNREYGPFINPETIVKCTLFLLDLDPDLQTAILSSPRGAVHLTTPARILDARLNGDTIEVQLTYFKGTSVYLLINVEARAVYKDSTALPLLRDHEVRGDYWRVIPGFTLIRATLSEKPLTLSVIIRDSSRS